MTKDFEPIKDLTPTERYIPNGPSLLSFGIKKTLLYVTGGENGGFQQLYAYDDEGKSIHHNGFSVNFGPIVQGGGNISSVHRTLDDLWQVSNETVGGHALHLASVQNAPLGSSHVRRGDWTLFPHEEGKGYHVDLLVGEKKLQIETSPSGKEGVLKIDGEDNVRLSAFEPYTIRIPEPGVVYEYPHGVMHKYPSVAPLGRIISLPVGIALIALERIKATRSLAS